MSQPLDPRLAADSYPMLSLARSQVLLMKNAHYPWLVLVPQTEKIEFYRLESAFQAQLQGQINQLAGFIDQTFAVDKINIGMIGNVVSQMHIHIVGRYQTDPCWPGVVWGAKPFKDYSVDELDSIRVKLGVFLESTKFTVGKISENDPL